MSTQTETAAGAGSASVYLCAFGKHPGWNDHIDDLGIETERLAQVKRLLYVEGIGANIDAGTWDKLGPGQQLGAFGHVLMWRRPGGSGDLVLARLWSSSDGKGRTRYPMVVCAQLRGVSLRWALENVLPELERLETACKAAARAPDVVQLIDDARAALRGRAARAETPKAEVMLEPETIADLVSRPELGPDRQGLLRVLYQVQREMAAFARDSALVAGTVKGKSADPRPQQLRVPACSPTPAGAVSAWTQFMLTLVEPQHPMMIVVPLPGVVAGVEAEAGVENAGAGRGGWADVIVGDAGAAQLMCIRATPKGLPLTTEIPYTIDATFAAAVDRWAESVTGAAGAGGVNGGGGGARVLAELPPRERKGHVVSAGAFNAAGGGGRGGAGAARKGLPIVLIIVALAVGGIVLAVVLAMVFSSAGGGSSTPEERSAPHAAPSIGAASDDAEPADAASAQQPAAQTPAPSAASTAASPAPVFDAAAWRALCEAYRDWMSAFVRQLGEPAPAALYTASDNTLAPDATRLSAYLADEGLAQLVRPMVDAGVVSAEADALDPWGIAGASRGRDLGSLTRAPGDAAKTADAADKIDRALAIIGKFRDGVTSSWPAPAFLRAQATDYRRLGWNGAAAEAEAAAQGAGVRQGEDVAAGIDAALIAAAKARRIDAVLADCRAISQRGTELSDGVLAGVATWAESLPAAAGGTASLDAVAAALEPATRVAARLGTFLDAEYPGIDALAFHGSPEYAALAAGDARPDAATFDQWVYRARAFPSLDPSLDPRRAWEPEPVLEAIASTIRTLESPPLESPLDEATRARVEQTAAEVEAVRALPWNARTRGDVEARTRQAGEALTQARVLVERRLAAARERVGKSDAEVRQSLAARDRIVASDSVNAAWRSWRDALLKAYPAERYQELSKAAADLREALVRLDEEMVPPARLDGPGGEWSGALAAALAAQRETIVADAVKTLAGASAPSADAIAQAGERAGQRFRTKLAEAEQLSQAAASVHHALELGHTLDEPGVGDFLAAHRQPIDDGLLGPLGARLVELERLKAETDTPRLMRLVLEPTPGRPALALSAYRRLLDLASKPDSPWPASIDDAQQAARMRGSLAVAMSDIPDAARRDALTAEIAKGQAAVWLAWADRASESDIDKTLALAGEMGVARDEDSGHAGMPPLMQYNAHLADLRAELSSHPSDEAAARKAVESFVAYVQTLPQGPRARAQGLVDQLTALLAGQEPKEPAVDPLTLGPGSLPNGEKGATFVGSSPDDGKTLIFTHPRGFVLRFIRVEPKGGQADGPGVFYLGQSELSVGQAAGLLAARASNDDRRRALTRLGEIAEVNQGVRTWSVGGASGAGASYLAPAAAWLPKVSGISNADLYPDGRTPPPPSDDSPMQQLPPDVALWLARLGGCRLPTRAEWDAAWRQLGEQTPAQNWNIRDQSVAREDAHIATIESRYAGAPRPDTGVFVPSGDGREGIRLGAEAQTAGWDDGVLWFADVDGGVNGSVVAGSGVHHLMGNVAEYLLDAAPGEGAPGPRLADAEAAIAEGGIWIVGQSALLDRREPGVVPAPVTVDGSVDGFADVGLRLAFSAAGSRMVPRPLGERLAAAANQAQYLTAR